MAAPTRDRLGPWVLGEAICPLGPARLLRAEGDGGQSASLLVLRRKRSPRPVIAALRREVEQGADPQARGLARVVGVAQDSRRVGLVYEPQAVEPLAEWIVRENPDQDTRLRWLSGAVAALSAAHLTGRVHGALRPDTALVEPGGRPVLLGLGALLEPAWDPKGSASMAAVYAAPERFEGALHPQPSDDVYALGGLLYFLCVGAHPWGAGQSVSALLAKKRAGSFDPPLEGSLRPEPALVAVVPKAVARRPEDRYPDVAALARALRAAERWQEPRDTWSEFAGFFSTGSTAIPKLPAEALVDRTTSDWGSADGPDPHLDPALPPDAAGLGAALRLLATLPELASWPGWTPPWRDAIQDALRSRLTARPGPLVAADAGVRPASLLARQLLHSVDGRRGPAQLIAEHDDLESMALLLALLSRGVLRQRTLAGSFWDEDWSSVD